MTMTLLTAVGASAFAGPPGPPIVSGKVYSHPRPHSKTTAATISAISAVNQSVNGGQEFHEDFLWTDYGEIRYDWVDSHGHTGVEDKSVLNTTYRGFGTAITSCTKIVDGVEIGYTLESTDVAQSDGVRFNNRLQANVAGSSDVECIDTYTISDIETDMSLQSNPDQVNLKDSDVKVVFLITILKF